VVVGGGAVVGAGWRRKKRRKRKTLAVIKTFLSRRILPLFLNQKFYLFVYNNVTIK
jgi:hypothetical protein